MTALTCALLVAAAQPPAKPKYAPLAGRPQAADLLAAVTFDPDRLTRAVTAAKLTIAPLWKMIEADAGLKVKDIARAELYVEPEVTGPVPFWWAAAIRFAGKTSADKVARQVLDVPADARPRFVPGKRVPFLESPRYKFTDREYWGAALPDASTAVFGPRRLVWQTMAPGDKVTPLAAALEYLDPNHDVALAVAPGPLAAFLDKVNARRRPGDKDAQLAAFARTAQMCAAAVGYVDVNKPTQVRLEFHAIDEATVPAVRAGVEAGLKALAAAWPGIRAQVPNAEGGKALLAALDSAVATYKVDVQKKAVIVTAAKPADWPPK